MLENHEYYYYFAYFLYFHVIYYCDSAGVGRTGTLIAIDILLNQAMCERQVDIPACIDALRRQRISMVQTLVST